MPSRSIDSIQQYALKKSSRNPIQMKHAVVVNLGVRDVRHTYFTHNVR